MAAVLIGLLLWGEWDSSRVHVVNLVPSVAVVGSPAAPPAAVPPAPPRPEPRPAEPQPAPAPPRAAPPPPDPAPKPREALSLPSAPRARPLPPRPPALPRPGERELPPLAHETRPAPAPLPPVPAPSAESRPAPPVPPGQATGSPTGSGALTLDVSDFPHAWYLRQVLRKVEEQWQRQGLMQEPPQKPLVMVEIQRNGSIQVPRIEKTSGSAFYDQAALRAIADASPFPELPGDWPKPVLRVMFRFDLKQG